MTKTLTEQWREGEIFGFHYVKVPGEETEIHNVSCMDYLLDEYGVEVLGPVPSYDEYIELVSKTEQLEKNLEVSEKAHYKTLEQLRIATNALKEYTKVETDDWIDSKEVARKALKEMEGVK